MEEDGRRKKMEEERGKMEEGRRCRGRQRSVWCDNIKGWTGRSVTACSAAAQNRTEWRSILANLRTEDGT